ncbi:hypothetical protein SNEBB_010416 [Seison nebaliae]|nr:hypothetical protein SNEBB_010416 [Seison nebaliae]
MGKVCYGPNPNGTDLKKKDGIGLRLLSKMGWKDGDGLGSNKDGISSAITPTQKKVFTDKNKEQSNSLPWTTHLDNFEDVLSSLQTSNKDNEKKEKICKLESHETKCHRIRTNRILKSKCLSHRKEEEIGRIFGKSKRVKKLEKKKMMMIKVKS